MEDHPAISLVPAPARPGTPDVAERLRRAHELLDELLVLVATMRDEALTSTRPPPGPAAEPARTGRRAGLASGELRAAVLAARRASRPGPAPLFGRPERHP